MKWGKRLTTALVVLAGGCYTGSQGGSVDSASASATDGPSSAGSADGTGTGAASESDSDSEDDVLPEEASFEVAVSGMRRLSLAEYKTTVRDLLDVDASMVDELLPSDTLAPFDNDYTLQLPSEPLVKGAEVVAGDLAALVVEDPALREAIVPCAPAGPDDEACFREFVSTFGRRALRRPLTEAEVDRFSGLRAYGVEADDFWEGIDAALRGFLQHPEFLYRVELGEPVPDQADLRKLGAYEVGARLSYFLTGSTTPDWLLDAAEDGMLDTSEGVQQAAGMLLGQPKAKDRMTRFHALWLSYEQLSREGIFSDMHAETEALVNRVVFDRRAPWVDMLRSDETYLTPELADHYGLADAPMGGGWVSYANSGRAGLLSHGTFLSVGAKFGDTSPTQRGLLVRTRLFCQEIPDPPPDLMVDVDEPPAGSDPDACKSERYYMATEPACATCHIQMDLIGFGLESYDPTGAFRTTEPDRPDCAIDGEGDFVGIGTFNGPAELADMAIESGLVESCVATQLYRFAIGRTELDEHDEALLERVTATASGEEGLELLGFVEEYVASDAFRYRREEVVQ